jgi:uncharacterized protein YbaR (Trm112 family)
MMQTTRILTASPLRSNLFKPARSFFSTQSFQFDEKLLQYLACPLSKTPLTYDRQNQQLVATFNPAHIAVVKSEEDISVDDIDTGEDSVTVAYPVVKGIPILIPSKAKIIPNKGISPSNNSN